MTHTSIGMLWLGRVGRANTTHSETHPTTLTPWGESPARENLSRLDVRCLARRIERTDGGQIPTTEECRSHRQHPFSLCDFARTTDARRGEDANKGPRLALGKVVIAGHFLEKSFAALAGLHAANLLPIQGRVASLKSRRDDGYTLAPTSKLADLPPISLRAHSMPGSRRCCPAPAANPVSV